LSSQRPPRIFSRRSSVPSPSQPISPLPHSVLLRSSKTRATAAGLPTHREGSSSGAHGLIGKTAVFFGGRPFAITFTGLIIGSVIYSLPFVIQPIQNSFELTGTRPPALYLR